MRKLVFLVLVIFTITLVSGEQRLWVQFPSTKFELVVFAEAQYLDVYGFGKYQASIEFEVFEDSDIRYLIGFRNGDNFPVTLEIKSSTEVWFTLPSGLYYGFIRDSRILEDKWELKKELSIREKKLGT